MQLTQEQQQIVEHPAGRHGRVLAVAGSGKTTTMAHRLVRLIARGIEPHRIQVLMFNRLARQQFKHSLSRQNLASSRHPRVNTFHSYAWQLLQNQPNWPANSWEDEQIHIHLLWARRAIVKQIRDLHDPDNRVTEDDIDMEIAKTAIAQWKGALIPPDRAGFQAPHGPLYEMLYSEYERERVRQNAITYDDFVSYAVYALEGSEALRQQHVAPLLHLVVDEYQDVNPGQQRLLELLASEGADVMVVGDDDQTIYEWRGARSHYILSGYEQAFPNKPWNTYALSHSFRFGSAIAEASDNVIQRNPGRFPKKLTAYDPGKDCRIVHIRGRNTNRDIITEVQAWRRAQTDPAEIRVLVRTYAQANNLEVLFLRERIPYYVVGRPPFHQTPECQALLNYGRVAAALKHPLTKVVGQQILTIVNKPSRYLARTHMNRLLGQGIQQGWTVADTLARGLTYFSSAPTAGEALRVFLVLLQKIRVMMHSCAIGVLLAWMLEHTHMRQHYRNYYGPGEHSLNHVKTLDSLVDYARFEPHKQLEWQDFMVHLDRLDTQQGRPEHECIAVTTIHRVKGLEFEYVILPDCGEGYMPVVPETGKPAYSVYDRSHPDRIPPVSDGMANERRLFYVALTRSCRALLIGGPQDPKSMDVSRFLAEMVVPPAPRALETITILPSTPACPLPDLPDLGVRKQQVLAYLQALPPSVLAVAGPLAMQARRNRQWGEAAHILNQRHPLADRLWGRKTLEVLSRAWAVKMDAE